MYTTILVEKENGVATLTFNKPDTLNAMDMVMRVEVYEALQELSRDDEVGAIILTGAGRAFCAGGDISTMSELPANAGRKRMQWVQRVPRSIMTIEKPIIAAINGPCTGSGLAMALACDLAYCNNKAKFGAAFTKIGLIPDLGSFYMMPRKLGMKNAKEIVLLAEIFRADKAQEIGVVNGVYEPEELMPEVRKIAEKLANGPRVAYALTKALMNKSFETDYETSLIEEAFAQEVCYNTTDFKEGVSAFKEKRTPKFQGK